MERKKGRLNFHRVINDRSGFTLAELILVVGIIVILTGVSVMAASYYFRVLKLNEMDNTAKQIFIAAQNHLTSAQSTGELDRYMKSDEVKANEAKPGDAGYVDARSDERALGVLMDYKPSDVNDTSLNWPEPNEEFYYILHDANADGTDEGINNSVLKYALPKNAIDDYVNTEGKYIIEYDINTASVYGVFYTEKKNELSYAIVNDFNKVGDGNGRGGSNDAKNVRRNHEYNGENQIIGYYGGAMAEQWRSENKPLALNVQNGNSLAEDDPSWEKNNQEYEKERLTAIIRDRGNQNTKKIVLKVHGETSNNDALVTLKTDYNQSSVPPGLIAPEPIVCNVDCGNNTRGTTIGSVATVGSLGGQYYEYQIVLDDIVLEDNKNCHFAYLFPTFLPGEDLSLTAYSVNSDDDNRESNSVGVNSLFGVLPSDSSEYYKKETGERKAVISSFRHLENIGSRISGIQRKGNKYNYNGKYTVQDGSFEVSNNGGSVLDVDFIYTEYVQTADLDWKAYYAIKGNKKTIVGVTKSSPNPSVSQSVFYNYYSSSGNVVQPGTFCSINRGDILEYDGGGHVIDNVEILNNKENADNDNGGLGNGALFGLTNYYSKTNGYFNVVNDRDCTIKNLTLSNFQVRAPKNAAALVAESPRIGNNNGKLIIDRVLVEKGSIMSTGSSSGNAGALVGYVGNNSISVDKCASSATVECTGIGGSPSAGHINATDTGGLVGEIFNEGTFTNSYTGGSTSAEGKYSNNTATSNKANIKGTYTAGGILGRSSGNGDVVMKRCYSTCSVYSIFKNSFLTLHAPGYAGGLMGYKENGGVSFSNCYSTGAITGEKRDEIGGVIRGTLLGDCENASKQKYSRCYYLYYPDTYNQDVYASGNSDSNPPGVNVYDYSAMKAMGSKQNGKTTISNYRDGKYPFVMVNSTHNKNATDSNYYHYGDWPARQADSADDLLFAYRETIGNDTSWYVVGKDNAGKSYVALDTLEKSVDNFLKDGNWCYGFLCPVKEVIEGNIIDYFSLYFDRGDESVAKYVKDTSSGIIVAEEEKDKEKQYVFYKYSDNSEPEIITTPKQMTGWGNSGSRFVFNKGFAASIATSSSSLGTETSPYQIRSEKQLENINNGYLGKYYEQTLDIDLALDGDDDFTSIGKKTANSNDGFTGTYVGSVDDSGESCYSIKNFSQTIDSPEDMGLFGSISRTGTVKDLNLVGRTATKPAVVADIIINAVKTARNSSSSDLAYIDIGGFAAFNAGTVTNCCADLKIGIGNDITLGGVLVNAGGMFGSNMGTNVNTNTTSDCQFLGELKLDKMNCSKDDMRIRVGAFAGRNTQNITNCIVGKKDPDADSPDDENVIIDVTINNTANINSRQDKIGGFVGEHNVNNLEDCKANVQLSYDAGNNKGRYAYVGGFIGSKESSSKRFAYNKAYGKLYVNCKEGFTSTNLLTYLSHPSYIGQFGGNVNKDISNTSTVVCFYHDSTAPLEFEAGGIYPKD